MVSNAISIEWEAQGSFLERLVSGKLAGGVAFIPLPDALVRLAGERLMRFVALLPGLHQFEPPTTNIGGCPSVDCLIDLK